MPGRDLRWVGVASGKGILGVQPRGAEWVLWFVAYAVVHVTLDVTLAVAVAAVAGRESWLLAPVFACNVVLGFVGAQAVVGLWHGVRARRSSDGSSPAG